MANKYHIKIYINNQMPDKKKFLEWGLYADDIPKKELLNKLHTMSGLLAEGILDTKRKSG